MGAVIDTLQFDYSEKLNPAVTIKINLIDNFGREVTTMSLRLHSWCNSGEIKVSAKASIVE